LIRGVSSNSRYASDTNITANKHISALFTAHYSYRYSYRLTIIQICSASRKHKIKMLSRVDCIGHPVFRVLCRKVCSTLSLPYIIRLNIRLQLKNSGFRSCDSLADRQQCTAPTISFIGITETTIRFASTHVDIPSRHSVPSLCDILKNIESDKGKVKVVPCALTEHHAMKAYWGSGRMPPCILDLGTRWS
jgi:hypothetical protein